MVTLLESKVRDRMHHRCKRRGITEAQAFTCAWGKVYTEFRAKIESRFRGSALRCVVNGLRNHPAVRRKMREHARYWRRGNLLAKLELVKDDAARAVGTAAREVVKAALKMTTTAAAAHIAPFFYRYIQTNRMLYRHLARPLTRAEKAVLYRRFPRRLVDQVRVTERLGNETSYFNKDASGITLGPNFIIVRKGSRSTGLFEHELVHICQYRKLGLRGFAFEYARQYVESGFDYGNIRFEREARNFKSSDKWITRFPGYAYCR